MSQCLRSLNDGVIVSSLQRNHPERQSMLRSLGTLYAQGHPVNWQNVSPAGGRVVRLPSYPWQRESYWLAPVAAGHKDGHIPTVSKMRTVLGEQAIDGQDWFYDLVWQPQPQVAETASEPAQPGVWLVFADQDGVGAEAAKQLEQQGESCVLVYPGTAFAPVGAGTYCLHPTQADDYHLLLRQVAPPDGLPLRGILHLWSFNVPVLPESMDALEAAWRLTCASTLFLVQALAQAAQTAHLPVDGGAMPHLWFVTRGAQVAEADKAQPVAVAQSPLWGLGRVIALEHPEFWGGLIDLDPQHPTDGGVAISGEVLKPDGEDQIVYCQGERYVARLAHSLEHSTSKPGTLDSAQLDSAQLDTVQIDPDATYLITGGLGALGLQTAHWLAAKGARRLVLTSRRGLPNREEWEQVAEESNTGKRVAAVRALEEVGVSVLVAQADAADLAQMSSLLETVQQTRSPLRGIIHCAGALSPRALTEMDQADLQEAFDSKLAGAWILHQLTVGIELDFLVLFSSGAAIWGAAGLAHYAAANHFLDMLAHYRHGRGLPALSINWGWWADGGMATPELDHYFSQVGIGAMSSGPAFDALDRLLAAKVVQKTVAAVDWQTFKPIYEARRRRPLLERLGGSTRPVGAEGSYRFRQQLEAAASYDRWGLLVAHVRSEAASVIGFRSPDLIDLNQGFFKMGMDSLMTVQLCNRLERTLGCSLPTTTAFEYPTVHALARYLATEVLALEIVDQTTRTKGTDETVPTTHPVDLSQEDLLSLFDNELAAVNALVERDAR
jgi:acyl transferase domain-containing protein/acyl carrier protein